MSKKYYCVSVTFPVEHWNIYLDEQIRKAAKCFNRCSGMVATERFMEFYFTDYEEAIVAAKQIKDLKIQEATVELKDA